MKILLINPCLRPNNPRKFFPIGLGYIATALHNAGYRFTVLDLDAHRHTDDQFQAFMRTHQFDVVAFGCIVTHYQWSKWAIGVIRETQPHAKIIIGNTVASSIPNRVLAQAEADVAVIGEGDVTIVELLRAIERGEPLESVAGIYTKADGRVVATPPRPVIEDLDTLPSPNRELFDIQAYLDASPNNINEPYPLPKDQLRVMNINTARGCVFRCSFCYHGFQGTGYRYRTPQSVVGEILELRQKYGLNYVQFWDDLTFSAKGLVERFCDALIAAGVQIYWSAAVLGTLFAKPDERNAIIVKKMKQTGCVGVGYSIESANPEILAAMNKPITLQGFANTRRTLLAGGIASLSSVVFGYPQETEETIKKTIDFCIELGIAPSGGFLLPLPGTPMYDYALQVGAIKDEEEYLTTFGDRQDLYVNLTSIPTEKFIRTVMEEMTRCQKAVLGEEVSFENPMKTLYKRTRDPFLPGGVYPDKIDAAESSRPPKAESGSAYTVFDHYKVDGMVKSVETATDASESRKG